MIQSSSYPILDPVFIHRCTRFEAVFEGDSIDIHPGTESIVRVIFSPNFEGLFKATLELVFYHNQLSAWFVVRRMLEGTAGSLEDHKHLDSLGQEDDKTSREVSLQKIILLFPRDQRRKSRYFPDYEVPPMVQQAVDNSTATCPYDKNAPDLVSALRPDNLNMNTYAHYFAALLSVEDGHQQYVRSEKWIHCANLWTRSMFAGAANSIGGFSVLVPRCTFLFTNIYAALRLRKMTKIFCQRWPWGISFG